MKYFSFWAICLTCILLLIRCQNDASVSSSTLTSNKSEFEAFREFDEKLQEFETIVKAGNETLDNIIGLAILYNIRDDMWKQGGFWQSLAYTNRALQMLPDDPLVINNQNLKFHLKYGLQLYQSKILINVGQFDEAISILDSAYAEQNTQKPVFISKQKLSNLLLTRADAILPKGRKSDYKELIRVLKQAISLYPCQYQAYHKLASVLGLYYSSAIKPFHHLTNHTTDFQAEHLAIRKDVNRLFERTIHAIGHVHLEKSSGPNRVIFFNSTIRQEICTFQNDYTGLDVILPYSHLASMNAFHQSYQRETQFLLQTILSTFYWTQFQIQQDIDEEYPIAWYSLQQARYYEEYRVVASAMLLDQYNSSLTDMKVQHIETYFQPDYWPQQPSQWLGHASKFPIFIVGFFRSGSTLLESLLDAHPYIWGMGENSPFTFFMYSMEEEMIQYTKELEEKTKVVPRKLQKSSEQVTNGYKLLITKYAKHILVKMKDRYLEYHRSDDHRATKPTPSLSNSTINSTNNSQGDWRLIKHIVDKMLFNYQNIALIHLLFPNALILHTVRDPLDCLLSCLKNRFGDFSVYTLKNSLLIQEYLAYVKIMNHFRKSLPMLTFPNGQKRKALIDIRYEELVANPKKVMKEIFTLLDIPDVDDLSSSSSSSSSSSLSATKKQQTKKKKERQTGDRKVNTDPNEKKEEIEQQESSPLVGHSSSRSSAHHSSTTSTSSTNATTSHHDNSSSASSSWVDHFHEQPRLVRTASYLQVKEPIYLKAIGSWKKYSKQLQETIIPALTGPLKRMSMQNMLPFDAHNHRVPMNWKLDKDFDYQGMITALQG